MKSIISKVVVLSAFSILTGCMATNGTTVSSNHLERTGVQSNAGSTAEAIKVVSCPAPVAKISVARFECRASSCQEGANTGGAQQFAALIAYAREQEGIPDLSGFGNGLTDMLNTALQASGCFDVLDRELMAQLQEEYRLSGREMTLQSADKLVTGAITSLSYERSRSNIGAGLIPVIGGVSSSSVTAKIGLDVRIVDVDTGRVSYANTLNAESGRRNFGLAGGGLIGGGILGGSHSVKGGVEMEEASRVLILDAVTDIVERIVPAGQYEVKYVTPGA